MTSKIYATVAQLSCELGSGNAKGTVCVTREAEAGDQKLIGRVRSNLVCLMADLSQGDCNFRPTLVNEYSNHFRFVSLNWHMLDLCHEWHVNYQQILTTLLYII